MSGLGKGVGWCICLSPQKQFKVQSSHSFQEMRGVGKIYFNWAKEKQENWMPKQRNPLIKSQNAGKKRKKTDWKQDQFKALSGLVVCLLSGGPRGSNVALHQLWSCFRPWWKVVSPVVTSDRWGEEEEVQPGDRERRKTHKHIHDQCIESGEWNPHNVFSCRTHSPKIKMKWCETVNIRYWGTVITNMQYLTSCVPFGCKII